LEDSTVNRIRTFASGLILLIPLLTVVMAFQNCSQPAALQPDSFEDSSSGVPDATATPYQWPSPSPTATPGATPTPTPTGTTWEGSCVSRSTDDSMAFAGPDSGLGTLTAFTKGETAAFWFHASAMISARVCSMYGTGWSVKGTGNFDGIGSKDVIWRNVDGRLAIWLMSGSDRKLGAFLTNTASSDWKLEGTADFNGDNKDDLVFRHLDGRVQIWLMNGYTVTETKEIGTVPSNWHIRGVADFNADNKDDILYRSDAGQLEIWFMDGTNVTLKKPVTSTTGTLPNVDIKAVGDFSGDGMADLMFMDGNGTFAFVKMNGAVATPDPTNYQPITKVPNQTADVNFDGTMDILFTGMSNTTPYLYVEFMKSMKPAQNILYSIYPIASGWSAFVFDRN
jgi:hypothetical protein